ncbi:MAG: hypothetical protein R3E50_12145 [Halioglobus sp.]
MIDNDRIVGVQIEKLDIHSIEQDLTGNLSMVSGRAPWFVADLESDKLNITQLQAMLPPSLNSPTTRACCALRDLGAAQLSLDAKALAMSDVNLSDAAEVVSGADAIDIKQLDFQTRTAASRARARSAGMGQKALFESSRNVANIDLDQFLIRSDDVAPILPRLRQPAQ